MHHHIDKKRYQTSVARLESIFRDISETTNQVSTWRCPYKNAHDECTAKFGCQNQRRKNIKYKLPLCVGSDKLDYRTAWEI